MILAGRNQTGLTQEQIEYSHSCWQALGGSNICELVVSEAHEHSSKTRFVPTQNIVYLGADAYPGKGVEANVRMSVLACLAHELSHAERHKLELNRPFELPDVLIDEAETSLHASFNLFLSKRDREDLIEDARDRLTQWFSEMQNEEDL